MDGDRKGPVDWGSMEEDDLLSERGLGIIKEFIDREGGQNLNFSLLALVPV
jgi:ubiquitin carboxyl-terminal hydrolase L3